MKLHALAAAVVLAMMSARPAVSQQPVPARPALDPANQLVLDAHFLYATEDFITPDELRWNSEFVGIGRLQLVPSTASRGRAQFLVVGAGASWQIGERAWTGNWYRTRAATRQDMEVGKLVFVLNEVENGVYRAPRDRNEALNSGWFATTITDVSDIARNEVRAGRNRLSIAGLRVLR